MEPEGPATASCMAPTRWASSVLTRILTLRTASSLQLEEICPVRASGLLAVVHGAAPNERDPWFLTCEGDGHGIPFMPVRPRLSILRGNILRNDQAFALADLFAEPCGS